MAEQQEQTTASAPQAQSEQTSAKPKTNGAAPDKWIGKLPLRKPVVANGENVEELTFREPTGGDIERIGCPIVLSVFETQPKPVFDGAVMTSMMAHLAAVPPSTIRQMDPRDWQNGAMMLFHFFVPDQFIT